MYLARAQKCTGAGPYLEKLIPIPHQVQLYSCAVELHFQSSAVAFTKMELVCVRCPVPYRTMCCVSAGTVPVSFLSRCCTALWTPSCLHGTVPSQPNPASPNESHVGMAAALSPASAICNASAPCASLPVTSCTRLKARSKSAAIAIGAALALALATL